MLQATTYKFPKPIFIILVAFANDLVVVPVLNKIDLPNADPDSVKNQLQQLFDISPDSVLCASAKLGIGIEEIFQEIVRRIPPPNRHGKLGTNLRFLLQVGK
jgi:translation elongation factor EF-4